MSIYCSRVTLGHDAWGEGQGRVFAHPNNDLRLLGLDHWPTGNIDTAHIPAWCVPGHQDETDNDEEASEWLRVSMSSNDTYSTVLIDQDAARALIADLQNWLGIPKAIATTDEASTPAAQKPAQEALAADSGTRVGSNPSQGRRGAHSE